MFEHPLQFGGGDGDHGERVVEAQRVGDVELGDVAGRLARRRVGGGGKLGGAAAGRRERADRVADAAAVLDRDGDRVVVLLGVPEVRVGAEIAEVGLLGADLAAATFEVHAGAAEDVAVLLADDVGDARGLLDAVVVGVQALDHLAHEVALGTGGEGGRRRTPELRHRGVIDRDRTGILRGDRVADDVALIVEGDVEPADIGIFGGGVHQGQGLAGGVGEELRVGAAAGVAWQQTVVAVREQGVRAAADQHVDVAQERRQGLLVGELLQVGADDDLVEAGIGREHPVDLGVDLAGQQRDLVAAGKAVHRDVAESGQQRLDLRGGADEGDPLAVLDDDRGLGDLVRAGAGLGRGRAGLREGGEVAVAMDEAGQSGLAGEVQVGREVGELRADPGVVGGARRGAEIGADDVGDLGRPRIELVVAEHRRLDADDVLDGDVGAARGGGEAAVGARTREPEELVVDPVIGRRHLRVGAGDVERARDPAVARRERDRVRGRVLEPVDDGREVRRPLRREQAAFPVRGVQDLKRVGHGGGLLRGEIEIVLGDPGEGVAGGVGEGAGGHDHVVGGAGPQVGARIDRDRVAGDPDLGGVGDRDGAGVAGAVGEGDAAGPGPHRLAEAQDDVGARRHLGGIVGGRRRDEDRRGLVEAQADEDGVVVGFARRRAAVEVAGGTAEIEVVVDGVRLVGVDVPLGDPGDLTVQARVGEAVVEGAVGAVEDVGIGVGKPVLGEVGEAGRLEDVEGILLDVGIEVAEQDRVAVLAARRPQRDPLGERRRREFALLLPAALAVALVGIRPGPGTALRLEVVDDRGEVLVGGDLVEGHRE